MAFVGLVGLYACNVRRLGSEKRNAANFLGCFALAVACITLLLCFRGLSCCCFAPVLCLLLWGCGLCCWLSFPLVGMTKRKGKRFACPLFVGCGWFYMFSAAFIASSFDFEKIHPAPQVRCALNLPPRVFKVSLIARVSPIIARAFSE